MKFLSVIIPVYNERKRIRKTLESIRQYLSKQDFTWEVIIVDDGSTDNSREVIREIIAGWENFRMVGYTPNRGKGAAVKYGIFNSEGQNILFMDADGSTPIDQFENFKPHLNKHSIIIGSRYLEKGRIKIKQPFFRTTIARLSNFIIRLTLGLKFHDTQCGFKCFKYQAAKEIFSKITLKRWGFDFEVLAIAKKYRYPVVEIAVDWYNERGSQVKLSAIFRTLIELLKVRWNLWRGMY